MQRTSLLLLAALLSVSACSLLPSYEEDGFSERANDLKIETDKSQYAGLDTVTVQFTNETGEELFLLSDGCGALEGKPLPNLEIERREGGEWANRRTHGCIALYQPPAKLESGQRYQVSFRVGIVGEPLEPGTYRYSFDVRRPELEWPESQLAKSRRVSNTFEVKAR